MGKELREGTLGQSKQDGHILEQSASASRGAFREPFSTPHPPAPPSPHGGVPCPGAIVTKYLKGKGVEEDRVHFTLIPGTFNALPRTLFLIEQTRQNEEQWYADTVPGRERKATSIPMSVFNGAMALWMCSLRFKTKEIL